MIYKLFSIFDSKCEIYLPPFVAKTQGEAIRLITDLCSDKSTSFAKYPTDYCLFELGSYDDSLGQIDNLVCPKSLGIFTEYCRSDQ